MNEPLDVTIRPLTPSRWKDLEALFAAKGCSIPRGCWCMYYRESGKVDLPPGARHADERKARMRALCEAGPPPGLLAYHGRTPVGWVTLAPRAEFAKLQRSPVMKPVDDTPLDGKLWSIVCFVVPPAWRHRGVAHALLHGAVGYARKRGARIVEAYPVDKRKRGADDGLWHGAKSMYDRAGFTEVARRKPERPVVRLQLQPADAP